MKKIFLIIIFLFYNFYISAQLNEVWGIWNTDWIISNIRTITVGDGTFVQDNNGGFLIFESNFRNRGPQILYDGGGNYRILNIIHCTVDMISLYIEEMQVNLERRWENVYAKINIHFINEDQMWMEIDFNDPEYPTTSWFNTSHFGGRSLMYWRKRIDPVVSTN